MVDRTRKGCRHKRLTDITRLDIATYFGQSTGDGIQFQFRSIKKDAETLRKTVAEGGDPLTCPISTDPKAASGTPSKTTRVRATPTKSAARGATSVKRARATPSKHISSEDDKAEDDDDNENWSEKDMDTPTKRPKTTTTARRNATPGRQAASAANDTIANASSQLNRTSSFGSSSGADANPPSFSSIFGQPEERKPDPRQLDAQAAQAAQAQAQPTQTTAVFRPGSRSYVGHSQIPPHNYMSSMTGQANMMDDDDDDDDIDGEI